MVTRKVTDIHTCRMCVYEVGGRGERVANDWDTRMDKIIKPFGECCSVLG